MLRVNLLNALEDAKQRTLEIADSTRHPIRKQRALEAYQQACELKDFLEHTSHYRLTDEERHQSFAEIFKEMGYWLFNRKPKRRRVFSIILGLYRRRSPISHYYYIRVEQSTDAEFRVGEPSGYWFRYGD